ncbi:MAG: VTT domain-containing protein [Candidatus Brockarchaeota archaeon]|nr:VTT domain-containing protein [Candidatus Brockarchaeota archaeon]
MLERLNEWLLTVASQYGYLGIFAASFLGAASIIFPVPYTVMIFYLGSLRVLEPPLIAVSGALGSALGEFFGYFLGYYGRSAMSEERRRKMNHALKIFSRYGAISIFLFALTPLPDDLIFIPLGMMRYSLLKAFVPSFVGKLVMCSILAYGGYLSIGLVESVFGDGGFQTVLVSAILLLIIIVAMLKVDWEKVFPLEGKPKGQQGSKS